MVAVNTLTAYLLLSIAKPNEALEFIQMAERIVFKLIELATKKVKQQNNIHVGPQLTHVNDSDPIESLDATGDRRDENDQFMDSNLQNRPMMPSLQDYTQR